MQKFLIVTADDFGLHESINESVERAARAGVLRAASLMVAAPAAGDAVRRARTLPELRVGLHLVLADGVAMLAPGTIPGLADARGHMNGRLFARSVRFFALPAVRRQLEAEIRAQFAEFARTGLVLDHVNVHKHLHLHPTVLGMLLRIGRDYGLAAVRVPDEPLWFASRAGRRALGGALLLKPWVMLMKRRVRAAGLIHNDTIFGIGASGAMDERTLLAILARLPDGRTEIYLHPGAGGRDELAALLSPEVRARVRVVANGQGGFRDAGRPAVAAPAAAARKPE